MKAESLALAAFLPQLSGQSVVLMSDNASIVAYLWHQSSTVSHSIRGSTLDRAVFGLPDSQVYSREEERFGGPAQSSRPGSSHGMVPSSEGFLGNLRGVRASPSRPLCHPHQYQASSVRVPGSGPDGLEAGRVPAPVGPSVYLCLPTVFAAQAGFVESSSFDLALVSSGGSVVSFPLSGTRHVCALGEGLLDNPEPCILLDGGGSGC